MKKTLLALLVLSSTMSMAQTRTVDPTVLAQAENALSDNERCTNWVDSAVRSIEAGSKKQGVDLNLSKLGDLSISDIYYIEKTEGVCSAARQIVAEIKKISAKIEEARYLKENPNKTTLIGSVESTLNSKDDSVDEDESALTETVKP